MIEIIPEPRELERYVTLAHQHSFGFEYNDFYDPQLLDDESALRQRIALYQEVKRPEGTDTLHGVFYDIVPFSSDSGIRRHSFYRMQQSVEIAQALGCRAVIFHTGITPQLVGSEEYRTNWLKGMADAMGQLLRQSGELEIYCENMFDESPRELADLAEAVGEPGFGICLDVAHMRLVTEEPEKWFQALSPYIRHFHLNDTRLIKDDHWALGSGSIDWPAVFGLIEQYGLMDKSMLLEVKGLEKVASSLDYLQGLRPGTIAV